MVTAAKNLDITQTQADRLNSITVTENPDKSVMTFDATLYILSPIDLIIKSGESTAIIGVIVGKYCVVNFKH